MCIYHLLVFCHSQRDALQDGTILEAVSSINWTNSGAFFINYLLQKTFIGFLFSLFRVTTVFTALWKRWRAKTDRQIRKASELSFFRFDD